MAQGFLLGVDQSLYEPLTQYINMRRFRMDVRTTETQQALLIAEGHHEHYDLSRFSFSDDDHPIAKPDVFWRAMFALNLPWITSTTSEQHIPQHMNLDLAHLIAFDKGCYPGQEIIARLHFIGKVKKRLQLITHHNPDGYPPGTMAELDDLPQPVEICAPSVQTGDKWQTQAVVPI